MKKKSIFLFLLATILFLFPKIVSAASNTPLYRLYHPDLRVHLYTKDKNEYTVLGKRGWNQEGLAWVTANGEGDTVFRLYHPGLKVHLYTKDKNEYQVLATRGWQQEGTAFYSEGSLPIYRLYHTGMKKHLYTKDENEYKVLATRGWKQEGIAFYGLTSETQKVTTETVKTTEVIPFKTITKDDKNLYKDETKVQTKGINGSIETTYKVTYIDGIETKRIKIKESKKDPVDEVILKGTKDRIVTKTETKREILSFNTIYQDNETMEIGQSAVNTKGVEGFIETTYTVTYTNGVETGREIVKENRKDPIDEVVLVGAIRTETKVYTNPTFKSYQTEYIDDPNLDYGLTRVVTEGKDGYKTTTIKYTYNKYGSQIKREVISEVETPPQNQVIAKGTRLQEGDVALPWSVSSDGDRHGLTLFALLNKYNEDELFNLANGGDYASLDYTNMSAEDIAKIKASIDMDQVNHYFLEYVNADRQAQGLQPLVLSDYSRQIAGIRAQEQAEYGSVLTEGKLHIRPDGSSWKTVDTANLAKFEEISSNPGGHNILANLSEKYIAMDFYYNSWKQYSISSKNDITKVGLGIGLSKGTLRNSNSSVFGKDDSNARMVLVAIAE